MFRRDANAHMKDYLTYQNERAMARKFAEAIANPSYAYSRCLMTGGSAYVVAYGHDAASPTGIMRMATCLNFDEAVAIMDAAGKPFPLSPTEGLNKSGANA